MMFIPDVALPGIADRQHRISLFRSKPPAGRALIIVTCCKGQPDAARIETELPRNPPEEALSTLPVGHRISFRQHRRRDSHEGTE
jgi:hypothetical protein